MEAEVAVRFVEDPYQHFSVLADGVVGELRHGFECPAGRAWMAIKVWANSQEEAFDMAVAIGGQIGFKVDGRMHLSDTPPEAPPKDNPYGYSISFTPYAEEPKYGH